jgi:predicted transcriptional regulator of viral defense system
MASKTEQYIDSLTAKGKISFTIETFSSDLGISYGAALVALKRLKDQRKIVSPSRGYYLVLTPEFRRRGCLPPDFFIDDLMRHLNINYYVALLSAAMYYGAAHQQPQTFQVIVPDKKNNIQCGNIYIEFIKNKYSSRTPVQKMKTRIGFMNVSTAEATAIDIMNHMPQCGGINRVATVIEELGEAIDGEILKVLAEKNKGSPWVNRLGYLLDKFGFNGIAVLLYESFDKNSRIIPLTPHASSVGMPRDKKWRVILNIKVESDLDDTN